MLSEHADPLVGQLLGKDYRVIEPIGFGGMAVVYLVEHQTLHKRFAAKVLSTELAKNLEARARFTQEAHASSQLDHENIVNISDFGVTNDQRPFFVMELLRGQTLDQRLAGAPMTLEEVVAVSVPVARALAFAHAEGIVHRDVKPENIFLVVRSQGRWGIKVVDFGIAKTPQSDRLTKMGQTLGSPHFMSPEACRGDDVDHRADIYSFGIILYLLTCGKLPFDDPSLLKILQLHVTQPLPRPRDVNPDLSPALAAVIERALAKDPDQRYPSMSDLLVDFEAAIPQGADRLLIEQQSGGAPAFRVTPFSSERTSGTMPPRSSIGSNPPYTSQGSATPATVDAYPTAPRSRRGLLVAVLGLVAAGAVGGVLFMQVGGRDTESHASSGPSDPSTVATPTVRASAEPVAAPAVTIKPAAVEPAPPVAAPVAPPVVVKRHHRIESDPAGAIVWLEGKRLGTTPLEIDLDARDASVALLVAKPGFEGAERTVNLRDDITLDVKLARKVASPPPKKTRREPVPDKAGSASPQPNGDPTLDIRLSR